MTVKTFLSAVQDWQDVCVEDDNYNVYAADEAMALRTSKDVAGLSVVCSYVSNRYIGNRGSKACIVIIAKKTREKVRT